MKAPAPQLVEIEPDVFQRFDLVAADPVLRARAIALAQRRRAHRRYDMLVLAFAYHDHQRGLVVLPQSLAAAAKARPKPRRMSSREIIASCRRWARP